MRPSDHYAAGVAAGRWQTDAAQQPVLHELDRLHAQLTAPRPRGWRERLGWGAAPAPISGLYLWGGVGRGKTFLTELLCEHLAGVPKRRWHFHRFMVEVHARIRALPDTADTVAVVAAQLADELRLLVLDEFFVSDIADAMILGRLLDGLFARGVVLVTTSNIEPAGLYRDGLQRARFLPAIALLEKHCAVVKLDSQQDYRLRQLTRASTYLTPLGDAAEARLAEHFEHLAADSPREAGPLRINDRDLAVKAMADGLVWFEFATLCEGARAAADYIEIARDFHTVLISNLPLLDALHDNAARRFVHLIDEFYDRNVNLLVSAAAEPLWIYSGEKLRPEFERTSSRLIEMRSAEYLAREHRP